MAAAFIACVDGFLGNVCPLTTAVKIVVEPVGTGTRCAEPMSLPFNSGITRPIAFAAPVELGTMLTAAARALLEIALSVRSVQNHLIAGVGVDGAHDTGLDRVTQSFNAFAMGARQLVVQEAAEMMCVIFALTGLLVYAVNDGRKIVACRSGDNQLS